MLFDLNGTIINDMDYHRKAWVEFSKRHSIDLNEEEFMRRFSGSNNREIIPSLFNKQLSLEEILKLGGEKEAIYREIYAPFIKEVPGLTNLLVELKNKNIKLAVTTTAIKENREFALKSLDLEKYFELIVGDEQVGKGKPDPEIYLLTAKTLQVDPLSCVVFEDTPAGVKSGKSAGMKVIGLLTTHTPEELKEADIIINDFTQIELN